MNLRHLRPFGGSIGLVMAEGAAVVMLERSHALRRNADLCRVAGYGASLDAYRLAGRIPTDRAAQSDRRPPDAGLGFDRLSTPWDERAGGVVRTLAIKNVFGERAYRIQSTQQTMIGHARGVSAPVRVYHPERSARRDPTINLSQPDQVRPRLRAELAGGTS
jgi:3-oxoacyl-(acyl-carrier-protein) synthase